MRPSGHDEVGVLAAVRQVWHLPPGSMQVGLSVSADPSGRGASAPAGSRRAGDQYQGQDAQEVGQHQEQLIRAQHRRRFAAGGSGRRRTRRTEAAPSSALPGRQEAKTTSAMQIQPRPLTISKKKALKADMVRNAPPTRHQRAAGHQSADAQRVDVDSLRLDGSRIVAGGADRETERRPIENPAEQRHQRQRERVNAVCCARIGPRSGSR